MPGEELEIQADDAWCSSRAFFDLPLEQKLQSKSPDPGCPRGYFPLATDALAKSLGVDTPPDIKESLSIGPLRPPERPISDTEIVSGGQDRKTYFSAKIAAIT